MDPNQQLWNQQITDFGSGANGSSSSGSSGSSGFDWKNALGNSIGGLGSLGAGLFGLFGGGQNPADAASQYYNQIGGVNQNAFNPYIQAGQGAMGNLEGQYSNLLSNPGGVMNEIGQSFHQSPGFQFALNQAMQGGNRGMAAGGLAGSPSNQMQNMGTATQMGNQDYYNYLQHALGLYGTGLQGEQGLMGQGFNASGQLANNLSQGLIAQGQNAYQGAANNQENQGNSWGNILSGIGSVASAFI